MRPRPRRHRLFDFAQRHSAVFRAVAVGAEAEQVLDARLVVFAHVLERYGVVDVKDRLGDGVRVDRIPVGGTEFAGEPALVSCADGGAL